MRSGEFHRSVYDIHANAKMNASAPIDATSACAMCVQVVIRSWMGVMSGTAVRSGMGNLLRCFESRLGGEPAAGNPGC